MLKTGLCMCILKWVLFFLRKKLSQILELVTSFMIKEECWRPPDKAVVRLLMALFSYKSHFSLFSSSFFHFFLFFHSSFPLSCPFKYPIYSFFLVLWRSQLRLRILLNTFFNPFYSFEFTSLWGHFKSYKLYLPNRYLWRYNNIPNAVKQTLYI